MNNYLCIIPNTLTTIFSIIAIIMINIITFTINTHDNMITKGKITQIKDNYNINIPIGLVLASSLLITFICIIIPQLTNNIFVKNIMILIAACILLVSSSILIKMTAILERIKFHGDEDITYTKVILYITSGFGILTGIICVMKSIYQISKRVNK